eukprot:224661-Alexandrium_andersonii.AAC.1
MRHPSAHSAGAGSGAAQASADVVKACKRPRVQSTDDVRGPAAGHRAEASSSRGGSVKEETRRPREQRQEANLRLLR